MPLSVGDLITVLADTGWTRKVDKPWGHEYIVETDSFLLKKITVNDGCRTSLQYHRKKREIIIPLEGVGHVYVHHPGHEVKYLGSDRILIAIEPGTVHRTVGPITILEVTTLDNEDVVRVEDDYGRKDT